MALALLLLSLTRPVGPAVVLVILVHGLLRFRHRSWEHFLLRDRLWVLGVAVGIFLAGLWPLCVALMTGEGDAYLNSMANGVLAFPLLWPFVERTKGIDRKVRLGFALVLAAVGLVAQWVWINDYVVVTTRIDGTLP